MSLVAAIRQMLAAGMPLEHALTAAEIMEATPAPKSKGAERQRRWRDRLETSRETPETVETPGDAGDVRDVSPLPLPPLPQTPSPPTPSPGVGTTRTRPARDDLADARAFGRFWELYPRKVAKPEAAKAFTKAVRRITGPDPPAVIVEGLERHLPVWAETEPDLVPHPTTWLNQDRFNDHPQTRRAPHDRPGPHPTRTAPDSRAATRTAVWSQLAAEEDRARAGGVT